MSIIALKVFEDSIHVASDGLCTSDDRIVMEDAVKIHKINDNVIIGATGLYHSVDMFRQFIKNEDVDDMDNLKFTALLNKFKNWIDEEFGWNDEIVKEFGGFLLATPTYHAVGFFDENSIPYVSYANDEVVAIGSTNVYTKALIENGINIEEAIRMTAKHYTSINDNIRELSIPRCKKS